ncbi:hypothetical protein CGJ73_25215, partial [Vibrio parahaemolyticus]
DITKKANNGDLISVDGLTGEVVVDPTDDEVAKFKQDAEAFAKQKAEWALLKTAKSITADGKHFDVAANIGTPKDLDGVLANG